MDLKAHWEQLYRQKGLHELSWTQSTCDRSLAYVASTGIAPDAPILDVGGGASVLVDQLLAHATSGRSSGPCAPAGT